jgi:glycosyltransferase involved in cell wall biosynthesis
MGGGQKMLLNLAVLLKQSDKIHPILLIPNMSLGVLAQEARKENIECMNIPTNKWYLFTDIHSQVFQEDCNEIKKTVEGLKKILTNGNFDIILVNTMTNISPMLAAVALNIPVITWVHGILDSYVLRTCKGAYRILMDRSLLSLSERVVFNSRWTEAFYKEAITEKKAEMIYNWTYSPTEKKEFDKNSRLFICLNSIEYHKGILNLLEAGKLLRDKGYQFKIEIYGNGEDQGIILDKITGYELSENIILKGFTLEVSEAYNNCLALIQPSYFESFGMTVIEAMAHGRAVIATNSGGPEEIVTNGSEGFIVEAGNNIALAKKMAYLLNHKELAEKMGHMGEKTYRKRFSSDFAKNRFLEVIEKTIASFTGYSTDQLVLYDLLNLLHRQY